MAIMASVAPKFDQEKTDLESPSITMEESSAKGPGLAQIAPGEKDTGPVGFVPSSPEEAELSRRVNRKMDLAMLPLLSLVYLFNGLDKGNIGNAETQGMTPLRLIWRHSVCSQIANVIANRLQRRLYPRHWRCSGRPQPCRITLLHHICSLPTALCGDGSMGWPSQLDPILGGSYSCGVACLRHALIKTHCSFAGELSPSDKHLSRDEVRRKVHNTFRLRNG
jgi:hypothetical protein